MQRNKKNLNKDYLKIASEEIEVSKDDIGKNFEEYLKLHFRSSLRKTGKRKWRSFFWILFMFSMSVFIYALGAYKMFYLGETFS